MKRLALAVLAVAAAAAPAAQAAPTPRLTKSVVVKPAGGKVTVKPRGGRSFRLRKATAIRTGSTVDTTHGKVKLTSALSRYKTQSGVFSQGRFVVTQKRDGLTDLKLTGGSFAACEQAKRLGKPLTGAASKRRRLFGRAHGRFRTRGRNSSATVRGTTWTTEDRCDGTVTENKSPDADSMIETKTNDLEFDLKPGQTATGYCNKFVVEPDTYCMMLLAQPADGLIGAGIITQVVRDRYALCVVRPDGEGGCSEFPLSQPDQDNWRYSVLACPVGSAGKYYVGWSFDYTLEGGVNSFLEPGALSLELDVAGPNVDCVAEPPVS